MGRNKRLSIVGLLAPRVVLASTLVLTSLAPACAQSAVSIPEIPQNIVPTPTPVLVPALPSEKASQPMSAPKSISVPSLQPAKPGQEPVLVPLKDKSIKGRVVKSLVSLGQIQRDERRLDSAIDDFSKFLEDTMVQISYPVLIPTVTTNPITLGTPNTKIYSGHYQEPRNKHVVSSVQNIAGDIDVLSSSVEGIDVPVERDQALKPLIDDVNLMIKNLDSGYLSIYGQIKANPTFDGEQAAATLFEMKKYVATMDQDLRSIFRIINLKDVPESTVDAIVSLNLLSRDANWLGIIANSLHDDAKQLNPLTAIVSDAQNQGWLAFGPTMKQYSQIEHHPYQPMAPKLILKQMSELSQYIEAVQRDINQLKLSSDKASQVAQLNSELADVKSRYDNLRKIFADPKYFDHEPEIADQAKSIADDMESMKKTESAISSAMVGGNSVL